MLSITDIPIEIFLDNILPILPLEDLVHLECTNKFFALLCKDETFWKRKLAEDYNFPDEGTARTSGWKFIYTRLTKPRVFVWGKKDNGRLGLQKFPHSTLNNVPFPVELKFPGTRIVSLVAGGMSFHALDSAGHIHVWGTLDGTTLALRRDGFSETGKTATTPLRLDMPITIRSISCGRLHSSALDSANRIWTFVSWGRPFRMTGSLPDLSDFTPIQVECGWAFSSALTKSGDVMVWWPLSGQMGSRITSKMLEMDAQEGTSAPSTDDGVIQCATWDLDMEPVVLPPLPPLPDLVGAQTPGGLRIIKIAGFDNRIIALTNHGHVLLFDSLWGEQAVSGGSWKYLPKFSEVQRVRRNPVFVGDKPRLKPPNALKITHISAHFLNFIAYSESVVLMGTTESGPETEPKIIVELQNQSVISVVLGDYHSAAVTSTGKLLSWGAYSDGALGLGDPGHIEPGAPGGFPDDGQRIRALETRFGTPPAVNTPTEVRFDHHRKQRKERFCISAAASGWHTGALVIDLEPNQLEDESDIEVEEEEAGPSRVHRLGGRRFPGQHETPPIVPGAFPDPGQPSIGRGGGGIFRIGFAGRGMHRGGRGG